MYNRTGRTWKSHLFIGAHRLRPCLAASTLLVLTVTPKRGFLSDEPGSSPGCPAWVTIPKP